MEKALDKCDRLCNYDTSNRDQSCGDDETVHKWDEAVAYYAGALQQGEERDIQMYSLADAMCSHFGTCGTDDDEDDDGTSSVNLKVYGNFREGQHHLLKGQCASARKNKEKIVRFMTIPLIQATLRNAHRRDHYIQKEIESGTRIEKLEAIKGRLISYAASVLPIIHNCSELDARTIYDNVQLYNEDDISAFSQIKTAFENNYECMGIKCEEVGGFINSDIGDYYDDSNPCSFKIGSKQGKVINTNVFNDGLPKVASSSTQEEHRTVSSDDIFSQGMFVPALITFAILLVIGIFIRLLFRNWTAKQTLLNAVSEASNKKHLDDSFALPGKDEADPVPLSEKITSLRKKIDEGIIVRSRLGV